VPQIPVEFFVFGVALLGIALVPGRALLWALLGLGVLLAYKLTLGGFADGTGWSGLLSHLGHEWVPLANLFGLLTGFALLANHFSESRMPVVLPSLLPDDWKGALLLLVLVFVLSSFLDNIAAAVIGGTMARSVFKDRVHLGYVAAIVAASNAGGSGSVIGDTTTTMMWIDGVSALAVFDAYVAAVVALLFCGTLAAFQQQRYAPIVKDAPAGVRIDWARVAIVAVILVCAMVTNFVVNSFFGRYSDRFPYIGAAVWLALLVTIPLRRPDFAELPGAARGSVFLLALVLSASLMPVERLPVASWQSTFVLGFVSAVFDNIPLTALALEQGGYDWGMLAYCVGFGGSMLWFGSSAGVAISNLFPESRSALRWLRDGWHVAVAYVLGFFVLLFVLGWHPTAKLRALLPLPPVTGLTQIGGLPAGYKILI